MFEDGNAPKAISRLSDECCTIYGLPKHNPAILIRKALCAFKQDPCQPAWQKLLLAWEDA